jgi:hypothetical protein
MMKNLNDNGNKVFPEDLLQKGFNCIVEAFDLKGKISEEKIIELETLVKELKTKLNILNEEMEMIKRENLYYKTQNERLMKDNNSLKTKKIFENPNFDIIIDNNKSQNKYESVTSDNDNHEKNKIHLNKNLIESNFRIPPEKHYRKKICESVSSRNTRIPIKKLVKITNNSFAEERIYNLRQNLTINNENKSLNKMSNSNFKQFMTIDNNSMSRDLNYINNNLNYNQKIKEKNDFNFQKK